MNTQELPKYKSHKTVWAFKIGLIFPEADKSCILNSEGKDGFQVRVSREYMKKHNPQSGGYYVKYRDGYESFSPAEAFESGYTLLDGIKLSKTNLLSLLESGKGDFGDAVQSLKNGKKVSRSGWNGKGMYIVLNQSHPVNGHLYPSDPYAKLPKNTPVGGLNITQGKAGQMLSFIVMKTAGDSKSWGEGMSDYVPWLASQTDMLSEDWGIVE